MRAAVPRDLCRARHHGKCRHDAARQETRRRRPLLRNRPGARLGARAMSGHICVIGIGPGAPEQITPQASAALAGAEALFGYGPYLNRVPARPGQTRHASDNREEADRAVAALRHAAEGARVAVISGGDPGLFPMAAAVW